MALFNKDTSKEQKIGFFLFVLFLLLVYIGMNSYILIYEDTIKVLYILSFILTIYALFKLYKIFKDKNSMFTKNLEKRGKNVWVVYFVFIFLLPPMIGFGVTKGLSSVVHNMIGKNSTMVVTVLDKSSTYKSNSSREDKCVGGVKVEEFKYMFNDEVCGLSKIDWLGVESGDRIELIGRSSFIGFSYDKYNVIK